MQPANTTTIASCFVESDGTQACAYVGSDQRVYQLVQQDDTGAPYQTVDLLSQWQSTANISLPFPRPGTGPRGDGPITVNAYRTMSMFFLFYIDTNDHVQALPTPINDSAYLTPGWPNASSTIADQLFPDLTLRTGAPPAAPGSGIASWGWDQNSQHVVYVGTDGNVWELYWPAGAPLEGGAVYGEHDDQRGGPLWLSNNLSASTGYTGVLAPKKDSPLAATMFEREGSQHVVYIAGDGTIRELYYYNGGWGGNNLTQATGATTPAANAPLAIFASNYEDTLHVVFLGADQAIHELWWGNGGWQPDHSISQYGTPPASDTAIIGYAAEFESTHHVIYLDTNINIQELYHSSGGWDYTTLNFSAGSGATPPLNSAAPLAGNVANDNDAQHVFYLDNKTRVHELYRHNNHWSSGRTTG